MAGDGHVAPHARQGGARVVARALAQVGHVDALDHDPVDPDAGDLDLGHRRRPPAVPAGRSAAARWSAARWSPGPRCSGRSVWSWWWRPWWSWRHRAPRRTPSSARPGRGRPGCRCPTAGRRRTAARGCRRRSGHGRRDPPTSAIPARSCPASQRTYRLSRVGPHRPSRSAGPFCQVRALPGASRRSPGRMEALVARPVLLAAPMEPVIHLRDAVALLGRFPALAGATLDVGRGEVVLVRGPERGGQDHAAAGLRRPRAGRRRRGRGARPRPAGRPPVGAPAGSACWATPTSCTTTSPSSRTSASGPAPRAPPRPRSPRRSTASASRAGWRTHRWAGSRPGSGAARRWPRWWLAAPSCGCSTSPTPASTPRGGTASTHLIRGAAAAGATVVLASHELDRAGGAGRSHGAASPAAGSTARWRGDPAVVAPC